MVKIFFGIGEICGNVFPYSWEFKEHLKLLTNRRAMTSEIKLTVATGVEMATAAWVAVGVGGPARYVP